MLGKKFGAYHIVDKRLIRETAVLSDGFNIQADVHLQRGQGLKIVVFRDVSLGMVQYVYQIEGVSLLLGGADPQWGGLVSPRQPLLLHGSQAEEVILQFTVPDIAPAGKVMKATVQFQRLMTTQVTSTITVNYFVDPSTDMGPTTTRPHRITRS